MVRDDLLRRKPAPRNGDAGVVEWVWDPEALTFNPRPLFGERSGVRAARTPLRPLPERPAGGLAYGLSADGEALVARGYDGRGDVRQEAYAHADGGTKTWRTFVADVDLALRPSMTFTLEYGADDRLLRTIVESEVVREVESYARDARGRIVRIVVERGSRGTGVDGDPRREEYVVTYDDGDEPLTVTEIAVPGGIVFDRTARPLARDVKYVVRELVHGIAEEVVRIGATEQVRCVVLSCESGGEAVPLIGIGVVSELADSWNPAEFRYAIGITKEFEARDPGRFAAACEALERGWRTREDDDGPLRLGYRVAHELNSRTWPAGTVSEEFVAIAVDETLDHLIEQARLSAPVEKIEPVIAKYMHD